MAMITVSLRIDKDKLAKLKDVARKMSVQENRDIYYTDLIREAVNDLCNKEKTK